MDTPVNLHLLPNDGEGRKATQGVVDSVIGDLTDIALDYRSNVHGQRAASNNARLCLWDNQNNSGLKLDTEEAKAFPFHGASDVRLRLADTIVNVLAAMCTEATRRSAEKIEGVSSADGKLAGHMRTLLRWVIRNQLGTRWDREITRIAQWMLGDQPGVAIMGVYWHEEYAVEMETSTVNEMLNLVAQTLAEKGQQVDPEWLSATLLDPASEPMAVEMLSDAFAGIQQDSTIRKMLRALREDGAATYPVPKVQTNSPRICAHRMMDDIFVPPNTDDLERARSIYVREWLSEVDLRERAITHGYSQSFVDTVVGKEENQKIGKWEGQSFLSLDAMGRLEVSVDNVGVDSTDDHKGTYEIVTAYFRSINNDGVPGIYYIPFHAGAKLAAHDQKLLPYAHGRYPFVAFSREHISKRLLDSRGIPHLIMTAQSLIKRHTDGYSDYTQLKTLKPLATPANRPTMIVNAAPLAQNKVVRPGEIAALDIAGDSPQTLPIMLEMLGRQVDAYFGIPNAGVPELVTQILNQNLVNNFLGSISEVCMQVMQLCQQYMSDETIALATGTTQSNMPRSRSAIQGRFQVSFAQNAIELNPEYFIKMAEVIGKTILPIDVGATVERAKLVTYLLRGIDPSLAESVVRPQEEADEREVEDEQKNLALIMAGVEPVMKDAGQNHRLRMQTIQEALQKNPEALRRIQTQPDSLLILQRRLKHLEFVGETQVENATTGRNGAKPALDTSAADMVAPTA